MKTIAIIGFGSSGVAWKEIPNSIPEGATLSFEMLRGGAWDEVRDERVTTYFQVCHVHAAIAEDVRVLGIVGVPGSQPIYENSLGPEWSREYSLSDSRRPETEAALKFRAAAQKAKLAWAYVTLNQEGRASAA